MGQAANTVWVNRVSTAAQVATISRRKASHRPRVLDGIVLAMIIALCATCVSYYNRTKTEFASAMGKNQAAADKVTGLANDVEKLERDVLRLRTDSKAVEELARHKLGLVREDDVVINLTPSEPQAPSAATPSAKVAAVASPAGLTRENPGSYNTSLQ